MNPYADQSGDEYSLHCLTKEDIELLQEAVHLIWRQFPVTKPETKPARIRLAKLNKAIDECI